MDVIRYRINGLLTVLISSNGKLAELRTDYCERIRGVDNNPRQAEYRFSDKGEVTLADLSNGTMLPDKNVEGGAGFEDLPVVFETPIYFFDIQFDDNLQDLNEESIEVRHHLNDVAKRFYRRGRMLFAEMSFVNEPGKFRLEIKFKRGGSERTVWLEFFVASTKMDVKGDYKHILEIVERHQRESLFTPYAKTVQNVNVSEKANAHNDPYWTVYFDHALDRYEAALKKIIYEPHRSTVGVPYVRRADRVRNWTPSMAREFARYKGDAGALRTHGFVENVCTSTYDTPENRFVKMTLETLGREFNSASARIKNDGQLSDSFKKEFKERTERFGHYARMPFMQSISQLNAAVAPSLVLQMRPGYADIRIVWNLIHSMFTTDSTLSRSTEAGLIKISALYEYWCFLEVKRILAGEDLNGNPVNPIPKFKDVNGAYRWTEAVGSEKSMHEILKETGLDEDEKVSSIAYQCKDPSGRLLAEVIYQQSYGPNSEEQYSKPVQQRPDIVIRFYDKNGVPFTYLFDAKYQIENGQYSKGKDAVPRASLDQMHRYRDAILWRKSGNTSGVEKPSHEVVGAYVLYPADETKTDTIYEGFDDLRREQNIGAFPLLPGKSSRFEAFIRELVDHIDFGADKPKWLKGDAIPQKGLFYTEDEADVIGDAYSVDIPVSSDMVIHQALAAKKFPVSQSLLKGKKTEEVKRLNFKVGDGTAYVCGSMSNGLIQKSQFLSQGINFEVSTPAPYYIFEIE